MAKKKGKYKVNPDRATIKEKAGKVKEIINETKDYSTLAVIDLRGLPDSLLQNIRKNIRKEGGRVRIAKKAIMERVFDSKSALLQKKDVLRVPVALAMTNQSPYLVNKFLNENKKRRAAKVGEIAPFEIAVPEGETDLPPGPALSELKGAGLNVQIKAGKIVVAKTSVVAKPGEAITDVKAKALQKLGIMPFEVGAKLLFAYDGEYLYGKEVLDIDAHTLNPEFSTALKDAFNFSLNSGYPTGMSIGIALSEAFMQSRNAGINGNLYSSGVIEQLLTSAIRQGSALGPLEKE